MSEDNQVVIFIVTIAIFIGLTFGAIGYVTGYNKAFEDKKKWECEFEYSNVPYQEIEGGCLKYFDN